MNVDASVKNFIRMGIKREKIVLVLVAYGRSFKLKNRDNFLPGSSSLGIGSKGSVNNFFLNNKNNK